MTKPLRFHAGLAVALAVLALAGCTEPTPSPRESGLPSPGASTPASVGSTPPQPIADKFALAVTGTVTASPGCPGPQRAESPCPDKPVAGAPVELTASGTVVARTTTDAAGRFRVTVPAGTYEITARNTGYASRVTQSITVNNPGVRGCRPPPRSAGHSSRESIRFYQESRLARLKQGFNRADSRGMPRPTDARR